MNTDVLILGAGPAGSTVGTLLRKYNPELRVLILEREVFPRDHVGESQLPATAAVLHEMGVWDKVEAANFPIKIGSTYRWGRTDDLWNLNFLSDEFQDLPRPGVFEGQRAQTAFQVDRSIYDKILLDHAEESGCEVRQGISAVRVDRDQDSVTGIDAEITGADGFKGTERLCSRYYVDATGGSGLIRRAMDVQINSPTNLRNVAFWDYWQDAAWAESIGNGGTRVQVLSLGWGWIWFIPITSNKTSIGLVTPADHLRRSGLKPEELYNSALKSEPRIASLIEGAQCLNRFQATKDWSYISERLAGDNWFLSGDACGFADPILAAGMTLAHIGARKLAYTILEIERGERDVEWLKEEFDRTHRAAILQHIRFADFWYSANGCFTDLKEYCSEIARDAGISLDADSAFQWLSTGGFAASGSSSEGPSTVGLNTLKLLVESFSGDTASWSIASRNEFRLNLVGATEQAYSHYASGRVAQVRSFRRGNQVLPLVGGTFVLFTALSRESDAERLAQCLLTYFKAHPKLFPSPRAAYLRTMELLEVMIAEKWVIAKTNKKRPFIQVVRSR